MNVTAVLRREVRRLVGAMFGVRFELDSYGDVTWRDTFFLLGTDVTLDIYAGIPRLTVPNYLINISSLEQIAAFYDLMSI